MFGKAIVRSLLAVAVMCCAVVAQADTITHGSTTINMDFVNVGNAGNAADNTTYGAVGYNYRIGTYEVTADQWAAVLAAAPSVGNAGYWSGSQPTGGTSWYEAAKFCNWLTTGDVNSGVYNTSTWAIMDHQTAGTTYGTAYFIPTEDEWYKAAYYDAAKDGGAGYWDYPTGSDTAPTATTVANQLGVVPGSANYNNVVGSPTDVGAYSLKPSTSAYGTFDQGGNVYEWNEASISSLRGWRGGAFDLDSHYLLASTRYNIVPTYEGMGVGFRVASVPEPGSLVMLAGIAVTALLCWWRKRA